MREPKLGGIDVTQLDSALQWRGQTMYDRDGEKIGRIEEIYLDQETDAAEWALVNTGLFGSKSTFVPIASATTGDDGVRVPFEKSHIKDAPGVDADGELSQEEEANLYRHYGMDYSESRSDTGLPEGGAGTGGADTGGVDTGPDADDRSGREAVGRDVSGPTTDSAMTRSEEELRVGTSQREAGRVRLRKHVVTDQVTETVPVQREEIRVEREPITDANLGDATSGPEISEEEHEVTLMEEEVMVEKRAVPKERVRLDKDVTTEDRQVSEEVRKEQIEVDGAEGVDDRADRA
jgi:uncharacterized protein (TIGR02271 family)